MDSKRYPIDRTNELTMSVPFEELAKWMDADVLMNLMHSTCSATISCNGAGTTTTFGTPTKDPTKEIDRVVRFAKVKNDGARATGIVAEYEPGISASPIKPSVRGCPSASFSRCVMVTLLALNKDNKKTY